MEPARGKFRSPSDRIARDVRESAIVCPVAYLVIVLTDIASPNEGQPRAETADQAIVHAELATGLNAIWRNEGRTNPAAALQRWFDDVMDGASGAYRRGTIAWLGVVAFAMVGFVNFDAIRLSSYVARRRA